MRKGQLIDRDNVLGALGEARLAGYAARKGGDAYRSDNPYMRGTECRYMWHSGWERATRDIEFLASETAAYDREREAQRVRRLIAEGVL